MGRISPFEHVQRPMQPHVLVSLTEDATLHTCWGDSPLTFDRSEHTDFSHWTAQSLLYIPVGEILHSH